MTSRSHRASGLDAERDRRVARPVRRRQVLEALLPRHRGLGVARASSWCFRADDYAERIPLTVADFDREAGLITVIFQAVGASTKKMATLRRRPAHPGRGRTARRSRARSRTSARSSASAAVSASRPSTRSPGAQGGRQQAHLDHRRPNERPPHPRRRDGRDLGRDSRHHGRRELEGSARIRHGRSQTSSTTRGEQIDRVVAIGPVVMMRAVAMRHRREEHPDGRSA